MTPNAISPANTKTASSISPAGTGATGLYWGGLAIPGAPPSINATPAAILQSGPLARDRPIMLGRSICKNPSTSEDRTGASAEREVATLTTRAAKGGT